MKGDLKDFRLHDLVQICCQHSDDVRLTLRHNETVATVFFSQAAIVHAESPRGMGKAALFDVLGWESGSFELQKDAAPPVHTIDQTWSSLLEEAEGLLAASRRHLEEGDPSRLPFPAGRGPEGSPAEGGLSPSDQVVRRLRAIDGVQAALLAGRNGEVLAHSGIGDPERLAALAAFVGEAASNIGRPLALGELKRGIVVTGGRRVAVAEFGGVFAGLRLSDEAAVDRVCSEAHGILGSN